MITQISTQMKTVTQRVFSALEIFQPTIMEKPEFSEPFASDFRWAHDDYAGSEKTKSYVRIFFRVTFYLFEKVHYSTFVYLLWFWGSK